MKVGECHDESSRVEAGNGAYVTPEGRRGKSKVDEMKMRLVVKCVGTSVGPLR